MLPEIGIDIRKCLIYGLFPYPNRKNLRQRTRQPTDNHPGNRSSFLGNLLLRNRQLAAFFLAQLHKSAFVAGDFVAGNVPFPALLPAISGEHPGIGKELPAGQHCVHDLVDIVQLPPLWLVIGVAQRLFEQLFGADHAAGVMLQKPLYLSSLGVLRHEILLHLHQLALDGLAELHGIVAAAVNRHGLCPDLQQIGSGGVLVLQDVNLRILRVDHNRQESPVPGPVKRQKVKRVGRTAEHALPQPVFGLGLIGCAIGFLLVADERADFLNAFGTAGGQHLRHLDDPMALQLLEYPVIVQLFQVIGKPLVPDRQQAEEAGLPSLLTAHQTEHFLIFGAGAEYSPDRSQQEMFQHFLHIVALVRTQELMKTGADAGRPISDKTVQHVLDGMVTVFIRYDGKGCRHFLLAGQAVGLLKIEKQILHVRIHQGAGISAPAQIPYNIYPVSQEIQPDGIPQQRVMAEHGSAVADGVGGLALLSHGQAFPHLVNALLRRQGFGNTHDGLPGGWR